MQDQPPSSSSTNPPRPLTPFAGPLDVRRHVSVAAESEARAAKLVEISRKRREESALFAAQRRAWQMQASVYESEHAEMKAELAKLRAESAEHHQVLASLQLRHKLDRDRLERLARRAREQCAPTLRRALVVESPSSPGLLRSESMELGLSRARDRWGVDTDSPSAARESEIDFQLVAPTTQTADTPEPRGDPEKEEDAHSVSAHAVSIRVVVLIALTMAVVGAGVFALLSKSDSGLGTWGASKWW